jgi:hypothetical protein
MFGEGGPVEEGGSCGQSGESEEVSAGEGARAQGHDGISVTPGR